LSTTYKVKKGDTYDIISRRTFGVGSQAWRIEQANPGVSLTPGALIVIPDLPGAPIDQLQQTPSSNPDEVAVLIDNVRFRAWTTISITRSIDAVDTIAVTTPFDPNDAQQRSNFKPFSYKSMVVTVGGVPLFTGTIVNSTPSLSANAITVGLDGYSTPGVLSDCTASAESFPLEFDGLTILEIAERLAAPFGVSVSATEDVGAIFDSVTLTPTKNIMAFLAGLAQQRGLIIGTTPSGGLEFRQSVTSGDTVAQLTEGMQPLTRVDPSFNGQGYFSNITGLGPVVVGAVTFEKETEPYTETNPFVNVTRPFNFTVSDAEDVAAVKVATQDKMGRMFGQSITYSISVSTWRDANGNLWEPNTLLTLNAPGAMVYNTYTMLIKSVKLNRSQDGETADIMLVLPGAYSGNIPEGLPWDE